MASEQSDFLKQPNNNVANNNTTNSSDSWQLVAEGDWLVGQRFNINQHALLGRDSSCDITIPGTHLSRRHAELAIEGHKLLIRDLGSANGTYVNDERITETELKPGDSIRFDVLQFRVDGPSNTGPVDSNATKVRPIPSTAPKPKTPRPPPEAKNWKTKPTSVGNRHDTIQITTTQKAVSTLSTLMAVIIGLVTLAGIGYLLTQL